MALYVPDASELFCLESIRANLLQGGSLRLYKSNYVPVQGDTAATYNAIEATFGGYAGIVTNSWGAVATVSNIGTTIETLRSWVATGAGLPTTIYGVYMLDPAGRLIFAELDPTGGITLSAAGQAFSYLPQFQLQTG